MPELPHAFSENFKLPELDGESPQPVESESGFAMAEIASISPAAQYIGDFNW